jgi:hypothetical protein
MSDAPLRAALIASESDREVVEHLEADLGVLGVRLQRFAPGGAIDFDAVVVVQGPEAAVDEAWRAVLAMVGSARLIPVVVEGVPDAEVPESLNSLNWVRWPVADGEVGVSAAVASTAVFTALNADFDLLQFHRELEAEAQAWVDGGCDDSLLIHNRRRVRRAAEHLRVAGDDVLSRPSAAATQFVGASDAETQRIHRKRRWRWIRRGAAVAVALSLFGSLVIDRKAHVANNHLAVMVYGAKQYEGRPDRGGMVAAATLIQGRPVANEMATQVLLESLSSPWTLGVLGVEETAGLMDAVPVRGGEAVYTIDASGELGLWDVRTAAARWQRDVGLGEDGAPKIAASENGRLLAVVDARQIGVARVAPWRFSRAPLPFEATAIAFDPQRSRFVVAGEHGLASVAATGARELRKVSVGGEVLDLVTGRDGRALALIAAGPGAVEVVDAVRGTVLRRVSGARAIERGTVGPAGEVVVDADDRLLAGRGGGLVPLGKEGSAAGVLRVLPGGIVASGGWGTPLELTDLATGTDLGPLCAASVAVYSVRATPSGGLLACTNGWVTELWSTADQRPLRRRPLARGLRGNPFLGRPGMVIRGGRDGTLTVKVAGAGDSIDEYVLPVGSGRVEAVAVSPRDGHSIVAGTSRGQLAEFDLRRQSLTRTVTWEVPGGGAIREVGWAREAGRLLVGTANGLWWRPRSCDACQDVRVAMAQARSRFWGCYPSDALDFMAGETERALALTSCQLPPEPR